MPRVLDIPKVLAWVAMIVLIGGNIIRLCSRKVGSIHMKMRVEDV